MRPLYIFALLLVYYILVFILKDIKIPSRAENFIKTLPNGTKEITLQPNRSYTNGISPLDLIESEGSYLILLNIEDNRTLRDAARELEAKGVLGKNNIKIKLTLKEEFKPPYSPTLDAFYKKVTKLILCYKEKLSIASSIIDLVRYCANLRKLSASDNILFFDLKIPVSKKLKTVELPTVEHLTLLGESTTYPTEIVIKKFKGNFNAVPQGSKPLIIEGIDFGQVHRDSNYQAGPNFRVSRYASGQTDKHVYRQQLVVVPHEAEDVQVRRNTTTYSNPLFLESLSRLQAQAQSPGTTNTFTSPPPSPTAPRRRAAGAAGAGAGLDN